jgi:hypothetical protein
MFLEDWMYKEVLNYGSSGLDFYISEYSKMPSCKYEIGLESYTDCTTEKQNYVFEKFREKYNKK